LKKHARIITGCIVYISAFFAGGCLEAASRGAVDGLNSAASAAVKDFIAQLFAPLTNGK